MHSIIIMIQIIINEGLIPNENNDYQREEIVDNDFIPLKNMSKFKMWYYIYLKRPMLYIYLSIVVAGALLALISQIGSIFVSFGSIFEFFSNIFSI